MPEHGPFHTAFIDHSLTSPQVNDDTIITSPNWAPRMIATLASNPAIPNFGVTGPSDSNNEKIFTHAFVHRTHMEVFGHLFPPYFKNWWSDDWISTVYGAEHTFRNEEVQIKHNVEAQKTKGYTRYQVDQAAQLRLSEELRKGHVQVRIAFPLCALCRGILNIHCHAMICSPDRRVVAEQVPPAPAATQHLWVHSLCAAHRQRSQTEREERQEQEQQK